MSHAPVVTAGILYLIIGATGAWWMHGADGLPWPADGLATGPLATAIGIGFGVGLLLHLAYRPLHGASSVRDVESAVEEAVAAIGFQNLLAIMPGAVLAEEVFFRGAMQQVLSGWHPVTALVLASVAFGLVHWIPPKREMWLYPVLSGIAGIAFGLCYWLTDFHLVTPFVAHLTVNTLNLTLLRDNLDEAAKRLQQKLDEAQRESDDT